MSASMKRMSGLSAEDIKSFVIDVGADCVGIVRQSDMPQSVPPRSPTDVLPTAKSVVVFGIAMLSGSINSKATVAVRSTHATYQELDHISLRLGRLLESQGYLASIIPHAVPVEMSRETSGLVGDISLRHAGVGAGLGVLGRNRLLITEEWGPRVRLAAVVTDLELPGDQPMKADLCDACDLCIEACPSGSLSDEGRSGVLKCLRHLMKYGLVAYTRYLDKLLSSGEEERRDLLRDPVFWNMYQAQSIELYYECFECLTACPVGK